MSWKITGQAKAGEACPKCKGWSLSPQRSRTVHVREGLWFRHDLVLGSYKVSSAPAVSLVPQICNKNQKLVSNIPLVLKITLGTWSLRKGVPEACRSLQVAWIPNTKKGPFGILLAQMLCCLHRYTIKSQLSSYWTGFRCAVHILLKREKIWWVLSLSHLGISEWGTKPLLHWSKQLKDVPILRSLDCGHQPEPTAPCVRGKGDSRSWKCSGSEPCWESHSKERAWISSPEGWRAWFWEHQLTAGLAARASVWELVSHCTRVHSLYCISKGPCHLVWCWAVPVQNLLGSPKTNSRWLHSH